MRCRYEIPMRDTDEKTRDKWFLPPGGALCCNNIMNSNSNDSSNSKSNSISASIFNTNININGNSTINSLNSVAVRVLYIA